MDDKERDNVDERTKRNKHSILRLSFSLVYTFDRADNEGVTISGRKLLWERICHLQVYIRSKTHIPKPLENSSGTPKFWHIVSIFKIFLITQNIKGKTNNKKNKLAVQILWRSNTKPQSKMRWIWRRHYLVEVMYQKMLYIA